MSRTAEQIEADRARYEEHQRKGMQNAPKALPGPSAVPAAPIANPVHTETIPGGWYWSTSLKAGDTIRIAQDALVGGSTAASNAAKYGGDFRNTRDNFILVATKLGLDRRDIPSALTLFAPVRVDADGNFTWREDLRVVGDYVELRAEMDLIVAFSNCPHPLDPSPAYAPQPVTVTRFGAPITADDLCRTATAEAVRGFENNAMQLA
jgi:uncharacterized protein YcgI (DUF1989 family)